MQQTDQNQKNGNATLQTVKSYLADFEWPKEGGLVEATFLKKLSRKAYFDLGKFGTGIVLGAEMANAGDTIRGLKPGDKIQAKIVAIDGEEGCIDLSISEASKQKVWQEAKELLDSGEIIKAKIASANAGGLMAAVGNLEIKAFLPVSHLSVEHYPRVGEDRQKIAEALQKFVGQELNVKIIDVNQKNNKLIVSEREVLSGNLKEQLSKYSVGQEIEGIVSGIADFGVFVRFADNPDIEGMIHISELSHRIVDNPKEIVSVNDQVKIKISDIKEGRVFLSLKALESDPWEKAGEIYKAGEEVRGTVYKINPVGAVINLEKGLQGLVHVSEFGGRDEMKIELQKEGPHQFVVDSVKPEEKRIILKLKK